MTTDTAPLIEHAIPAKRLTPLLHDRVRACGMLRHLTDGHPGPCREHAAWAATVHCPHHGPIRVLICDYHRGYVADGRRVTCAACERVMAVWMVERVR